ncbi:hypothetical protein Sjap_003029 [Stephania japonica]|uniref:Uncharacterized protein n=1 Tax=Stephania japonica TaxID=461633 RepID=A0AAP0KQC9_9MAGN
MNTDQFSCVQFSMRSMRLAPLRTPSRSSNSCSFLSSQITNGHILPQATKHHFLFTPMR